MSFLTFSVLPLHVDYNNIARNNQKRRAEFFREKGKIPVRTRTPCVAALVAGAWLG